MPCTYTGSQRLHPPTAETSPWVMLAGACGLGFHSTLDATWLGSHRAEAERPACLGCHRSPERHVMLFCKAT